MPVRSCISSGTSSFWRRGEFSTRGAKSVNAAGGKEGVAQEFFQYLLRREGSVFRLLHQFGELFEEIVRVVRAGGGFGVVLHREAGQLAVADAFDGQVVEIFVRQFERLGQGLHIDGEAVVLRGDPDAARAYGLTLEHLA